MITSIPTPTPAPAAPAATSVYRFVGAHTMILDLDELKEFGQAIALTDAQAETVLRGGGLILPAAQFGTFFTDAEMKEKTFPKFPGHWFSAPDDLKAKKKAAIAASVVLHLGEVAREAADAADAAVLFAATAEPKDAENAAKAVLATASASAKAAADLAAAEAHTKAAAPAPAAPAPSTIATPAPAAIESEVKS
jgi:hypothetical protein